MNTVSSIVLAGLMLILAIGMCSLVVEEWQEAAGYKIAYKLLLVLITLFSCYSLFAAVAILYTLVAPLIS